MELQNFIESTLEQVINAVNNASNKTNRSLYLRGTNEKEAVEFDVAVTVEEKDKTGGGGKIKVWGIIEGGGEKGREYVNTTVSRIKFGVYVSSLSKGEESYGCRPRQAEFDKSL